MIETKVETITPEVAARYLATQSHNRPVSPKKVTEWVSKIREGKWHVTHQGIAFDKDGKLLDGQHRLNAIIQSGISIDMMVTRGLDRHVFEYIDIGKARTSTDIALLMGEHVSNQTMAAAGLLLCRKSYYKEPESSNRNTVVDSYLRHQEALMFAERVLTNKAMRAASHSGVRAAIAAAYYFEPVERLEEFGKILSSGICSKTEDSAAIALRDYISKLVSGGGGKKNQLDVFAKSQTAIKAFCEHREIKRLNALKDQIYYVGDVENQVIRRIPQKSSQQPQLVPRQADVSPVKDRKLDEKYDEALKIVMSMGKASTSVLQRKLQIGYGRAAGILDAMQEEGIIGPPDGSKPRSLVQSV